MVFCLQIWLTETKKALKGVIKIGGGFTRNYKVLVIFCEKLFTEVWDFLIITRELKILNE